MSDHNWVKLTEVKASITFTCVCGGEHELDLVGKECDGNISTGWACDDCGKPLLVYVDVDARVNTAAVVRNGDDVEV